MNKKLNLVIGSAIVAISVVVGAVAMQGAKSVQVAFSDLPGLGSERVEVYGKLDARSIVSLNGANKVRFRLVDEKSGEVLNVLYDNPGAALAANFPNASHARVKGIYDRGAGTFQSDEVITKCPSKDGYNDAKSDPLLAREAAEREAATKKWQQITGLKG